MKPNLSHLKFDSLVRVRYDECDGYGHLNNATYARYMQQAALDASAHVGFDDARYAGLGTLWLIRETEIEYRSMLRPGERIAVLTWVGDFRRVRSRRWYTFHRLDADDAPGEEVARASTDWVYLDRATLRPTVIPPELIAAFAPYTERLDGDARPKFPQPPLSPDGAFTMARAVEWRDIDIQGHVNNAVYLNYIEECAIGAAAACGWSMARMREASLAVMARNHRIEYLQPLALGETVHVTTYLSEVRRATAVRHFRITNGAGVLAARARSLWMFVNPRTLKLTKPSAAFVEAFREQIATG